jgi:hypothetical protein
MATQFDPSWLPSTVAQSTAALVAIVGGFMVSRFVSIDSEMTGARRRLEEAEERHRVASEQRDQIQAGITRRSAREYLTDELRIDTLIVSETIPSAADLLAAEDSSTLSVEELRPYVVEAFEAVLEARRIAQRLPEKTQLPGWTTARRIRKIPVDDWDLIRHRAYDEVVERKEAAARSREEQAARKNDPFGLSSLKIPIPTFQVPALRLPIVARDRSRMDRLRDQREQSDRDVALSGAEVALARRAVDAIGRPRGLVWTLSVLTVLAVLGMVIPVIELWGEPLAGDAIDRMVTLVCFMVGLAMLLGYLWIYAYVLWRRQRTSGVSASTPPGGAARRT